ncbi:MAG: hypothetical protein Q8Q54_10040 [Methylococcales bacterium]|nr:hypothetical protein [Methylococcales bacterium]MDP3839250.1 hypothetical protein [Methylococcales bacterium]
MNKTLHDEADFWKKWSADFGSGKNQSDAKTAESKIMIFDSSASVRN